jgi:hypothetical protein
MEQWWNDTDRGKLKYWEKNPVLLLLCPPQIPHVTKPNLLTKLKFADVFL